FPMTRVAPPTFNVNLAQAKSPRPAPHCPYSSYFETMRKPSPELLDLLSDCPAQVTQTALALRNIVLREAPRAEEFLYSVYAQVIVFKFPGQKRGAFCNIAAYSRHVNLVFFFGALLPDPHNLLKGTGKQMRHIRFDSPADVQPAYL